MTFLKAAVIVPSLVSGVWLAKIDRSNVNYEDPNLALMAVDLGSPEAGIEPVAKKRMVEEQVVTRKLRIERILVALDRVAETAMQMNPDRAASLEPVILDLANQTLELTDASEVAKADTDEALDELETTISELVGVIGRLVEPEMSL